MNILYLNNSMHLGGDNKCILKLCKELKDTNKIVVASKGGILENNLYDLDIKHYKIDDMVSKLPHKIIINVKKLVKIINQEKIDIIHSHHRMSTLIAKIASRFVDIKVVHTQHLCIEDKFKFTNLALSDIKTITVSKAAKKILVEKSKLDEENITTIYNTVETENENKEVDSKLIELKNKGYFIVAQVSRVIEYKGIYDFVKIAKETIKVNDNIRFVFIGEGPELENLKSRISKENLDDYVYVLGRKDNVIEHLKYIDLLLLCSYIEGLPLAPLEAFSQGVPVIATNIDGTNEEIIDNYNGFLVEVKDIKGFKNKILKLVNDKSLIDKFNQNALDTYKKDFNAKSYINKHIEVYKSIK